MSTETDELIGRARRTIAESAESRRALAAATDRMRRLRAESRYLVERSAAVQAWVRACRIARL